MLSEFTDGFGSKIATFAETIANIGVVIVTTPFVLFFMLKDGHHFKEFSTNIMPPKFRKDFHDLLEKMKAFKLVHTFKDKLSFHSVSVYCCLSVIRLSG